VADIVAALRSIDATLSIWFWCWTVLALLDAVKEYRRGK